MQSACYLIDVNTMRSFKKAMKLFGVSILMVLALLGIGIGGAAPLPVIKRRENSVAINIELFDSKGEQKNGENDDFEKK